MMVSFIVAGTVCALAALCYSELASMVPVAGSAYTYSYAVMGEIMAWMVGWALILEYALGASAVAVGWSGFMSGLLDSIGIHIPHALKVGPPIQWGFLQGGEIGGMVNLPAVLVVAFVTTLLVIGTKESATFNAVLVVIKVTALTLFLIITLPMVSGHARNFDPFAPRGWGNPLSSSGTGILGAAASIFFAYVGFDAVSTAAEETKNPQRNVPIGLIGSLLICTVFYLLVAAGVIGAYGAQPLHRPGDGPRVQGRFARTLCLGRLPGRQRADRLLEGSARAHPAAGVEPAVRQSRRPRGGAGVAIGGAADDVRPDPHLLRHGSRRAAARGPVEGPRAFRTPYIVTIVTGVFVAIAAAFLPVGTLADYSNAGTLFAFAAVRSG